MQIEVYNVHISFKVERAAKVVQMEVKGTKHTLQGGSGGRDMERGADAEGEVLQKVGWTVKVRETVGRDGSGDGVGEGMQAEMRMKGWNG